MHISTIPLTPFFLSPLLSSTLITAATREPNPIQLSPILDILKEIGNAPPPSFLWTPRPSPRCAAVNAGELQCCQGTLAGDLPLIQWLAALYGYRLNPNDVNGVLCKFVNSIPA
ncbi:uncharacterized protein GGS25DRAFT_526185 [Hypoxylon fragiforme]|uniref:uncharacterized protein n=1 Tax=Hypoxylon fragiforme TaxID=63214 RepID=UPI0020C6AFBF|nr:uncharacterized protein GGS25DRAFT_526185 [Hypoxylon fragiforme]KAI2603145.1 hypothetical protein GGS25DRAFT_526185 [Hypoxylon fragiforme]